MRTLNDKFGFGEKPVYINERDAIQLGQEAVTIVRGCKINDEAHAFHLGLTCANGEEAQNSARVIAPHRVPIA